MGGPVSIYIYTYSTIVYIDCVCVCKLYIYIMLMCLHNTGLLRLIIHLLGGAAHPWVLFANQEIQKQPMQWIGIRDNFHRKAPIFYGNIHGGRDFSSNPERNFQKRRIIGTVSTAPNEQV